MDLPETKEELYSAYFLKEDLVKLCRKYNLPVTGSKENLLENICNFMENKPITKRAAKKNSNFVPS
ncbi:MAG: SAP domain-containing protein, partial [Prevotellaceae bacterium]|nr:SAP domain-containing protein [Prevotellaceae bacterium]